MAAPMRTSWYLHDNAPSCQSKQHASNSIKQRISSYSQQNISALSQCGSCRHISSKSLRPAVSSSNSNTKRSYSTSTKQRPHVKTACVRSLSTQSGKDTSDVEASIHSLNKQPSSGGSQTEVLSEWGYHPSLNSLSSESDRQLHSSIIAGHDQRQEMVVDTIDKMKSALELLQDEPILAVDLEFSNHTAYFPRLELIQVATNSTALFIFDAQLLQGELRPLVEILNTKELIFHGSSTDLRLLYQLILQYDTPCIPRILFDTQIATQYLNIYPHLIGLGLLVSKALGVSMNKGLGGSDWSVRPLTARQLQYAFDDVRYLHATQHALLHMLHQKGPIQLSRDIVSLQHGMQSVTAPEFSYDRILACYQDMQEFKSRASIPPRRPDDAWLDVWLKDSLSANQIEVLKALTKWREITAYKQNRNPRVLVKNDVLIGLCESIPESADELITLYQNSSPFIARNATFIMDLIEAVQNRLTKSISPLDIDVNTSITPDDVMQQERAFQQMHLLRLSPSQQQLFNVMSTISSSIASELSINPEVFAPPRDVKAFILTSGSKSALPPSFRSGYRSELLGRALTAIHDGGEISLKWDGSKNTFDINSISLPPIPHQNL